MPSTLFNFAVLLISMWPSVVACVEENRADPVENKWAAAVMYSVSREDSDIAELVSRFEAATSETNTPAVWVSFGDAMRRKGVYRDLRELGKSLGKERSNRSFSQLLSELGQTDDVPIALYKKATQVDGFSEIALARLATYGEGALAENAIKSLIKQDATNSLWWYLKAVKALQTGREEEAMRLVQKGNLCHDFRWFPTPIPSNFEVTYPDDIQFRNVNVVGKKVPTSALRYFLYRHQVEINFLDYAYHQEIYDMGTQFIEKTSSGPKTEDVQNDELLKVALAVEGMGTKLLSADPCHVTLVLNGSFLLDASWRIQEKIYRGDRNSAALLKLSKKSNRQKEFFKALRPAIQPLAVKTTAVRPVLLGAADPIAEVHDALAALRRNFYGKTKESKDSQTKD